MASKLVFAVLVVLLSLAVVLSHGEKAEKKNWVLLICSSKGWNNYGQQSDVYHAYKAVKDGGIPEEQIVVLAFDELAQSLINPYKGKIFHSYGLENVYEGFQADYIGREITKDLFLAVLRGDKEKVRQLTGRTGKVIESGPDDNLFVFIDDHGAPGVVSFWDNHDLTAKELNDTITSMHEKKRYRNMVIYIDACYSGSMFEDILSPNIGVYAATAANKTQLAWNGNCRTRYLYGKKNWICLGGLFSINWIYETESDDRTGATLDMQFQEAKIACQGQSNPKQYGDLSIALYAQSEFLGDSARKRKSWQGGPAAQRRSRRSAGEPDALPKHLMSYYIQKKQVEDLPEGSPEHEEASQKLQTTIAQMSQADEFMKGIATALYGRFITDSRLESAKSSFGKINWQCYEPVLKAVSEQCPGMSHREDIRYYAMAQYGILVNLCSEFPSDSVLTAVKNVAETSPLCKL